MAERRIAITGLGAVTPAGLGVQTLWEALLTGRRCVRRISRFDPAHFPTQAGGQLEDFSAREFVPKDYRKAVKVMARDIEIAVAAADMAFRDAGITTRGIDPGNVDIDSKRLGCNVGAGLICSDLDELGTAVNTAVVDGKFDMKAWGREGMNNLTPLWLLKYLPNMLACHVTIIHGAEGPSNTLTCGDASGHLTVGEAARAIARGSSDVVVAGGAESKLNPMGLLRQHLLKRLCTSRNDRPDEACRPFDADHDGTVVAEGGGLLILEDLARAESRGARVYAELAGFGAACDPAAVDKEKPTVGSLDLAAAKAIADAGIGPEDVDVIVAHGTGVPAEDALEAAAWQAALGPAAKEVPAAALTGSIGSLFAGAGGVALAAAAMVLHRQTVPATANFSTPAPGCELNLSDSPRNARLQYAITGAFTVGGQSGACVLKRYEP
ncbi:MAG TPA: beta-ketoacyl synthase N-terminal-like domain-containing protein [Phycisphaerae bacterium]|nr:beta-ketoacyl synthase N-terminal-like domain-containing protein [Phycisphaerae bacterium]